MAVLAWIVASALFAFYVANFGSYDKTYGTLGGIVTLLVWMWISNLMRPCRVGCALVLLPILRQLRDPFGLGPAAQSECSAEELIFDSPAPRRAHPHGPRAHATLACAGALAAPLGGR